MSSELDELMQRFAALGKTVVGTGPQHPTSPQPTLQAEIDYFLINYPALRRDPAYVAFLYTYAGATIESSDEGLIADIFGFQPHSGTHMIKLEGPIVDKYGFLCFAFVHLSGEGPRASNGVIDVSFSFDATGKHTLGVYRDVIQAPSTWVCADFLTWLRLLIETRGHLYGDPPGGREVSTIRTPPNGSPA